MRQIIVEAPASSANLGSGFDVFALGLSNPKDTVELTASKSREMCIRTSYIGGGSVSLPEDRAVRAVVESIATKFDLYYDIDALITSRIPIGVGLGSSAASSIAAAVAMNHLFELELDNKRLLEFAVEGEFAASGSRHFDNLAGALNGGFVIVSGDSLETIRFTPPKGMAVVILTPLLRLPGKKTQYSRSLLPSQVEIGKLARNVSLASTVVAGFAKGDIVMIGKGLEDSVVEPARKVMIPWFDDVKNAALQAGAAGVCISGAGPSMMAIVDSVETDPERIRTSMVERFATHGIIANSFITNPGEGTKIVEGP